MQYPDVLHRLNDRPFKPFGLRLSDGSVLEVVDPDMIIVGKAVDDPWTT